MKTSEELCYTCNRPYVKGEFSPCSNGFHCCRDCVWQDGMKVKACLECEIQQRQIDLEWAEYIVRRGLQ